MGWMVCLYVLADERYKVNNKVYGTCAIVAF